MDLAWQPGKNPSSITNTAAICKKSKASALTVAALEKWRIGMMKITIEDIAGALCLAAMIFGLPLLAYGLGG